MTPITSRRARPLTALASLALIGPGLGIAPATATAATSGSSLPTVTSGARPGPDVLYAPPPAAPQLENRDPRFRAAPLLVSGHEAYAAGEYLYQDFLYDDYGADTDGVAGPQPILVGTNERSGEVSYPTEAAYAGNAADLVEFRAAAGADEVVYRFTLNALLREDTTVVALALDRDRDAATGSATLPRDPGAPFPGTDEVITVWGSGGEHSHLRAGRAPVTTPLDVRVDLEANQLTVAVPRTVSDPRGTWRATLATGLFDRATGGWKRPATAATADTPGGAGAADPAPNGIFNLGFRFDEPVLTHNVAPDSLQSQAIRDDAPARFAHDIDFAALDAGATRTTVPATGRQVRLFPSRLDLGEGRDFSAFPQYRGQLQPYMLYVPSTYRPGTPAGLTLSLHSLGQHYWQYNDGLVFSQLGEQRGDLVLSPMARGDDGWYQREAEYDVFEAWNDVARRYTLDPTRVYSSGYSMGGYATYRLAGLYPDLFARAFTAVGPPGDGIWLPPAAPTGGAETLSNTWLENFRNVPIMNIAGVLDELVPYAGPRAQNLGAPEVGVRGLEQLGYDYRFVTYPTADHFVLARLGYDFPYAASFLGGARVDRDPAHVVFARVPASDAADLGLVHDHAYWVSDVRMTADAVPTSATTVAKGVVDVRSLARGAGEPVGETVVGAGVAQLPYQVVGRDTGLVPPAVPQNALELTLTDVASLRLDAARAGLDLKSRIGMAVTSTDDSSVLLAGQFPTATTVTRDGVRVPATVTAEGVTIPVGAGSAAYVVTRPGALG